MGDKLVHKKRDDAVNKIDSILKIYSSGLTITNIVDETKLNRSAVRIALAKLDGAGQISFRKIGMAKVYSLNKRRKK